MDCSPGLSCCVLAWPIKANNFFPLSLCIAPDGLQTSSQEWSRIEYIPEGFKGSPGPQSLADDGTVSGEFDRAKNRSMASIVVRE
jgi:hypothetical protein